LRPDVVASARAAGIDAGTDAAVAARGADIVVVNAAQTDTVLFDNSVVGAIRPEGVIISCATMSPGDAKRLASKAAAAGISYLDSPISGGATRAAEDTLTVLTSGPSAVFAKARPVLDAMSETLYHLGNEIGIAAAFKIVNQLLAGVHIAAACEALAFAKS
jgi:L-threonate 2-dehydrogenase